MSKLALSIIACAALASCGGGDPQSSAAAPLALDGSPMTAASSAQLTADGLGGTHLAAPKMHADPLISNQSVARPKSAQAVSGGTRE